MYSPAELQLPSWQQLNIAHPLVFSIKCKFCCDDHTTTILWNRSPSTHVLPVTMERQAMVTFSCRLCELREISVWLLKLESARVSEAYFGLRATNYLARNSSSFFAAVVVDWLL